ncbi:MAG: CvpA family protein [Rhodospirillales bacterium]
MNWLDIVLGILILISVVSGIKRGLARAAIGFGAVILGLFCALWFYGLLGAHLRFAGSRNVANLIAFFVIFLGVVLTGSLIGFLVDRLLKLVRLSWLNRLLGGAFGLIRGALVGAVVVMALMAFWPSPRPVAQSRLAPYVIETARVLVAAAPYEVKAAFRNSYARVKQIWAEALKRGVRRLPETEL